MFNALCENAKAQAANFPFCTIEPNVGAVAVPDPRLDVLSQLTSSQRTVPTTVEFVDIAGLVKGASKGEGLGNQFLANIRECDAIVQVGCSVLVLACNTSHLGSGRATGNIQSCLHVCVALRCVVFPVSRSSATFEESSACSLKCITPLLFFSFLIYCFVQALFSGGAMFRG
jgi:hypothetical protein